jgi:hypothetical protein
VLPPRIDNETIWPAADARLIESGGYMIRIVCSLTGAAALLFATMPSSWALSGDAPWCAVVNIGFGEMEWDCHYQTIEQCAPNVVAGNRGFCNLNPYYVAPASHVHPKHATRRHYRNN